MHGGVRGSGGVPFAVPDPNQIATQNHAIDAQKELAAIQFSQNIRLSKVTHAINFLSMRLLQVGQTGASVVQPDVSAEETTARAAAFKWLQDYFENDTEFEAGATVREAQPIAEQFATA